MVTYKKRRQGQRILKRFQNSEYGKDQMEATATAIPNTEFHGGASTILFDVLLTVFKSHNACKHFNLN